MSAHEARGLITPVRAARAVRTRLRNRVLVTLKSGDSFDGVLYEADDRSLVLRNASAVGVGKDRADVPLDGELLVLLADVAFIQRP